MSKSLSEFSNILSGRFSRFFPFFPVNKNNPQSFYPGKMLISFKVTRTSRIWKNLIMQHSISYRLLLYILLLH